MPHRLVTVDCCGRSTVVCEDEDLEIVLAAREHVDITSVWRIELHSDDGPRRVIWTFNENAT